MISHFGQRGLILWGGIATLVGSVVGAGILGIPYAVASVGFGLGLTMLIAIAAFNLILQLMYAEVIVRTKRDHQTPGYARKYLGKNMSKAAFVIDILTGYGALLAYTVGIGEVLQAVLGGTSFIWSVIFFGLMGIVVYKGIEAIKRFEMVLTIFIFLVVFLIGLSAHPHIDFANLGYWVPENIAIPYGVLLFALAGSASIPQVRQTIVGSEKYFPRVLIASNAIIFILYLSFMYIVLGVTGANTTEVGTIGLGNKIGESMIIMGNVLAVFTISTSFLTSGLAMRRMFHHDYGRTRLVATILTLGVPLLAFVAGARDFITVLSIVGGVLLGAQSMIIILTFWRAIKKGNRKPEFSFGKLYITGALLLTVYIVGALVTIL